MGGRGTHVTCKFTLTALRWGARWTWGARRSNARGALLPAIHILGSSPSEVKHMILQHVRHTLYLMNFFVVKLPPPSLHYINVECETVTYMYIDGNVYISDRYNICCTYQSMVVTQHKMG